MAPRLRGVGQHRQRETERIGFEAVGRNDGGARRDPEAFGNRFRAQKYRWHAMAGAQLGFCPQSYLIEHTAVEGQTCGGLCGRDDEVLPFQSFPECSRSAVDMTPPARRLLFPDVAGKMCNGRSASQRIRAVEARCCGARAGGVQDRDARPAAERRSASIAPAMPAPQIATSAVRSGSVSLGANSGAPSSRAPLRS